MKIQRRLESWDEIADYLKVAKRTAQRWEKLAQLPVHRFHGGKRGPVFAYPEDLDRWQQQDSQETRNTQHSVKRRISIVCAVALCLSIMSLLIWVILLDTTDPELTSIKVSAKIMTAFDQYHEILWETKLERELMDQAFYDESYCFSKTYEDKVHSYRVEDLNIDGKKEILVLSGLTTTTKAVPSILECFDCTGKQIWQFKPGKPLTFGKDTLDDTWTACFDVEDLDGDGRFEIIVISRHTDYFPSEISVLNHGGDILGQYYNSGWIRKVVICDLDDDGHKEILCAGHNNGYKEGVLFVLDSREIYGSSPQIDTPDHYCASLPVGREKYYIIFPRDPIGNMAAELGRLNHILIYPEYIQARSVYRDDEGGAGTSIIFTFNYGLELLKIEHGSSYKLVYTQMARKNHLDSPLDPNWLERMDGLLYWNGEEFTPKHSVNRHWLTR